MIKPIHAFCVAALFCGVLVGITASAPPPAAPEELVCRERAFTECMKKTSTSPTSCSACALRVCRP